MKLTASAGFRNQYPWKWDRKKPAEIVCITVQDTGCGISKKQQQQRIFERFYSESDSVKSAAKGFGIGLAVVKENVQLHFGEVSVQSEEGQGSIFTVYLPLGNSHLLPGELVHSNRQTTGTEKIIINDDNAKQADTEITVFNADGNQPVLEGETTEANNPAWPVMIIDDEESILASYKNILLKHGYNNMILCPDSRKVIPILKSRGGKVSMILLDLAMPHMSGIDLFSEIRNAFPEIDIIIATGSNDLERATALMRQGARDYLVKPVNPVRILETIQRIALDKGDYIFQAADKKQKLKNKDAFINIITNNDRMIEILKQVEDIAVKPLAVLIRGASGVGKELIAKAIHEISNPEAEFITVNISSVDDTFFSDTLFGHEKNAFTGAVSKRRGLVSNAENGILFLDEIGDLEKKSQVKLLRLIQEGEYYPLGADKPEKSNARIITATHVNLEEKIKTGEFRKDLYYRLKQSQIALPALKERQDDIPLLLRYFHEKYAEMKEIAPPPLELIRLLQSYAFPGNIRELENMIKTALDYENPHQLSAEPFRKFINRKQTETNINVMNQPGIDRLITYSGSFPSLEELKRSFIKEALRREKGNITKAARLLNINPVTIHRLLKEEK